MVLKNVLIGFFFNILFYVFNFLIFLVFPIIYIICWLFGTSTVNEVTDEEKIRIEKAVIKDIPGLVPKDMDISVTSADNKKINIKVHYLEYNKVESGEVCLFIHGAGSGSLAWCPFIKKNVVGNAIFLDMPGYGKSEIDTNYITASKDNVIDMYCEVILECINTLGLKKVKLIAHSFFGFFAIHFTNRNKDLVSQLILLSPAGLFTTLGKYGAYWSFFFSSLLPESFITDYGTPGLYVLNTIMDFLKCDYEYYWNLQYWLSPNYIGHFILSKFIYYDLCKACWRYPVSDILITLPVPISIVYGKNDCIIPFNMGLAVHSCNPNIDLYLIHDVGHSLHKELDGEPFANVFVKILSQEIKENNVKYNKLDTLYTSNHCIKSTVKELQELYTHYCGHKEKLHFYEYSQQKIINKTITFEEFLKSYIY